MRSSLAAVAVVALIVPSLARADFTVTLDQTSARPGDLVRATSSSCCYLSLYLVPAARVPQAGACPPGTRASGGCEPWSIGPPHGNGWIWVGRFFPQRPSFVFRVPRIPLGVYRPVVYCPPCYRGSYGSLIAGSQPLRVL
jgi:hypothetical protein